MRRFLEFIRFSHTIFALPFAIGAAVVAAQGLPDAMTLAAILWCMVTARTAAMLFNRVADWELDKNNPRTAGRHRLFPKTAAIVCCAASSALFLFGAWILNPLCFALSPVALFFIFFYSLTKRFTHYTQLFLGLALAVSPVGAWLAVTGSFAWPPLILALAVLAWVAGFDIIYATQDVEFDRQAGLHSIVVRHGIPASLRLAQGLHIAMLAGLIAFGLAAEMGWIFFASLSGVVGVLVYEHRCAAAGDLSAVNRAFFQSNALVGVLFVAATWLDVQFHFPVSG